MPADLTAAELDELKRMIASECANSSFSLDALAECAEHDLQEAHYRPPIASLVKAAVNALPRLVAMAERTAKYEAVVKAAREAVPLLAEDFKAYGEDQGCWVRLSTDNAVKRLHGAVSALAENAIAQRQDSVVDQLRDLLVIARREGMYDAEDFIRRAMNGGIGR